MSNHEEQLWGRALSYAEERQASVQHGKVKPQGDDGIPQGEGVPPSFYLQIRASPQRRLSLPKQPKLPMMETPVMGRNCWNCLHIYFDPGSPSYSEYTPGYSASINCDKYYWEMKAYYDTTSDMREKLKSAEKCADYLDYREDSQDAF